MNIKDIINHYQLERHPEGGWFRRCITSQLDVETQYGARSAVTSIYYLLCAGEYSRLHRVRNDEVWHFLQGDDIMLAIASEDFSYFSENKLGAIPAESRSILVPASYWQAARPLGAYALLACTVAPGFAFEDFYMPEDQALNQILQKCPAFSAYLDTSNVSTTRTIN